MSLMLFQSKNAAHYSQYVTENFENVSSLNTISANFLYFHLSFASYSTSYSTTYFTSVAMTSVVRGTQATRQLSWKPRRDSGDRRALRTPYRSVHAREQRCSSHRGCHRRTPQTVAGQHDWQRPWLVIVHYHPGPDDPHSPGVLAPLTSLVSRTVALQDLNDIPSLPSTVTR